MEGHPRGPQGAEAFPRSIGSQIDPRDIELAASRLIEFWTLSPERLRIHVSFHRNVLALPFVDRGRILRLVRHPSTIELRDESHEKGYPVLCFRDESPQVAIVGFQVPTAPLILRVDYATAVMSERSFCSSGEPRTPGSPVNAHQAARQLQLRGCAVDRDDRNYLISYQGEFLGQMPQGLRGTALALSWRKFNGEVDAIRRKALVE